MYNMKIIFLVVCLLSFSCQKNNSENDALEYGVSRVEYPLSIKTKDNNLVIEKAPKKVISLSLNIDEILVEISDKNQILALSYLATNKMLSNVHDRIDSNTKMVSTDPELILSLNPDLVFISYFANEDVKNILRNSNIQVYSVPNIVNINSLKETIYEVGTILDKRVEAVSLIKKIDERLKNIKEKASLQKDKKRVLYLSLSGYTLGKNTSFDEITKYVNAINVASELGINGFSEMPLESLLKTDIDFIVLSEYEMSKDEIVDYLYSKPLYRQVHAIGNGNIIVMTNKDLVSTSQYFINAIESFYSEINN